MANLHEIESRWQKRWHEKKIFEANPDKRPKFFANIPYPYINAYPHIGHLFTLLRADVFARFMRMKGYNVLFPQGWHATGSPIVNAAIRVKNREEKQVKIMKDMGFTEEDLVKFEEPEYWIKYFVPEFRKDWQRIGISTDWRREFHTTSINPHYDKFIQWQFRKLKEGGYVGIGKHPIVWCTTDNSAVGDHSRVEGEGETPQEFTLLKFKYEGKYLIAATLRPETVFGQTNLWVKPDFEYQIAEVNGESWIASEEFFGKVVHQEKDVKVTGKIRSSELIGRNTVAPMIGKEVMILPGHFCDPTKGTGIVTSVPSDAPDDWMGLKDLQENEDECRKYQLDIKKIRELKPIPIIDSEGLGDLPAIKVCEDMKIKNQFQRAKLDEAKKLVYKKGYYGGVMKVGKYKGMKVEDAKDKVKAELIKLGQADVFHELTGRVVCRCLAPSIVKIVSNQWFLFYGDQKWKKKTHKCLDQMRIYPEKARPQFEYVIDWLKDWACTREQGLGTKLPWDDNWVIESLSDSTIYMAYYTICHTLHKIDPELVDDNLFDYVLLGKSTSHKVDKALAKEMHDEFNYWYPFDFRNSGKDLIQNHLTFALFNHTAIFPEDKWPKGFGVNGWVTVDGQKMSKSLGNMIPLRAMAAEYSADVSRITILSGGESMDDPNWDSELAKSQMKRLIGFYEFCLENYNKGSGKQSVIDNWMLSELNKAIKSGTEAMEGTFYRSAITSVYHDIQKKARWYLRRSVGGYNKNVMNHVIESQVRMLAPFTPHVCEEIWEKIGKLPFVSLDTWPQCDETAIDESLSLCEDMIDSTLRDIENVRKLVKSEPREVTLFVAEPWKYHLFEFCRNEKEDVLKKAMAKFKEHAEEISKFLPRMAARQQYPVFAGLDDEYKSLLDAKEFLESETKCKVHIKKAEDSIEPKARQAMPGKPAILLA